MKLYTSKNPLLEKSYSLALEIVQLNKLIIKEHKEYVLSRQILKSGTNPGAMAREAVYAQSGKDFIHKLEIAHKEINETLYWLKLLLDSEYIDAEHYSRIRNLSQEVKRIITASILTKKKNLGIMK